MRRLSILMASAALLAVLGCSSSSDTFRGANPAPEKTRTLTFHGLQAEAASKQPWLVSVSLVVVASRVDAAEKQEVEIRALLQKRIAGLKKEDILFSEKRVPVESELRQTVNEKLGDEPVQRVYLFLGGAP